MFLDFPQAGRAYRRHQYWSSEQSEVLIYHEYLRDYVWLWCEHDELLNWGPGGLGKSAGWAAVCYEDYCADPVNTTTVLVSTSLELLEDRIWGEVKKLHSHLVHERGPSYEATVGKIVNSKPARIELSGAGRKRSGIFCIASPPGDSKENVKRQIGRHNQWTRILNDEANAVSDAAVDVVDNLGITGDGGTIHVRWGNPDSWLNRFGRDSMPRDISRSELYRKMPRLWHCENGGLCLFQDARKSPSMGHPEGWEVGMREYPFMHSKPDNERLLRKGKDSFTYWVQGIGFIPPGDVKNTVLSEAQILDSGATGSTVFWESSDRIFIWGLDPAYGGECECPIVPLEVGIRQDEQGYRRLTIQVHPVHYIERPASGDILEAIIAGVARFTADNPRWKPDDGAVDCTSGQIVVANALARKWQTKKIYQVGFNVVVTDLAVSAKNDQPAKKVYKDRWTELWMNAHEFVVNGHIRGLPHVIQEQLTNRRVKQLTTPMQIESKKESEWQGGWDEADAFICGLAKLREVYGIHPGMDHPLLVETRKAQQEERRQKRQTSKRRVRTRGYSGITSRSRRGYGLTRS